MVETTSFTFSLKEVTESLLKQHGIHEGKWVLAIEFGLNIGMIGLVPTDVKPGVMILANNLQLQRATEPGSPPNLIVDAAVVNPIQKPKKK
jgi:hypothetical protein